MPSHFDFGDRGAGTDEIYRIALKAETGFGEAKNQCVCPAVPGSGDGSSQISRLLCKQRFRQSSGRPFPVLKSPAACRIGGIPLIAVFCRERKTRSGSELMILHILTPLVVCGSVLQQKRKNYDPEIRKGRELSRGTSSDRTSSVATKKQMKHRDRRRRQCLPQAAPEFSSVRCGSLLAGFIIIAITEMKAVANPGNPNDGFLHQCTISDLFCNGALQILPKIIWRYVGSIIEI